jgi:ribonuclease P protein component
MTETFGRNRRLTRPVEFRRVYSEGRAYATPLFVCHILDSGAREVPTRLGLSASKRTGLSHDRFRYKRWAREVFRRGRIRPGADVVVSFRRAMKEADFEQFRSALVRVLERARLVE